MLTILFLHVLQFGGLTDLSHKYVSLNMLFTYQGYIFTVYYILNLYYWSCTYRPLQTNLFNGKIISVDPINLHVTPNLDVTVL